MSTISIFFIFLRLGLTSFGGPIAHLAYFRDEFVARRKWLSEHAYGELVSLCQFLPGPASSQVGIALGLSRGGLLGSIAAWLGFTLPSAILLVLCAMGVTKFESVLGSGWLHGLKVVAVAIVAQAIWGMGKALCPDRLRATVALLGAAISLILPGTIGQISSIVMGGIVGVFFLRQVAPVPHAPFPIPLGQSFGAFALGLFFFILLGLPLLAAGMDSRLLATFARFYRSGALVFGGGHVVLPLLQADLVPSGWISNDIFLAGYGLAQAVPGPLFTFAAYLGAAENGSLSGWSGAAVCLTAIFLPAFLLVIGVLPFWEHLRTLTGVQKAMRGINAAVVGILLSAFYDPVWTSAIRSRADVILALAALLLLMQWKTPPWAVVVFTAIVGHFVA